MAISKKLVLDNGIESKYHIVSMVNSKYNKDIEVVVLSFTSKDYYTKASKQNDFIREKEKLDNKIEELLREEKLDEVLKLQNESNALLNKISNTSSFDEYIIESNIIYIPFKDGFNLEYIENELVKTDLFKNGKIVK